MNRTLAAAIVPAMTHLRRCALLIALLCGPASFACAAPADGPPAYSPPAYPPPGHLRVFDDRMADEMEFRRKHAERDGQTDQAVDMTWRLSYRIRQVWGPSQSIQWSLYTGVARLWHAAGAHDRALAALERVQIDLSGAFWFDDFERAALSLYMALIHAEAANDAKAEAEFRHAFTLAERSRDITKEDMQCFRVRFAEVLGRNGKTTQRRSSGGLLPGTRPTPDPAVIGGSRPPGPEPAARTSTPAPGRAVYGRRRRCEY